VTDADDLPIAHPWTERVAFVECPGCDRVNELGTGVVINVGQVYECEDCGLHCRFGEVREE